jgi:hypothetical protein
MSPTGYLFVQTACEHGKRNVALLIARTYRSISHRGKKHLRSPFQNLQSMAALPAACRRGSEVAVFLDEIGMHKESNAGGRRNDGLLSSPEDKELKTDGPEEHAP